MKIAGHQANRLHGTLTVELDGGETGSLEIDIDVSDPRAFIAFHTRPDDDSAEVPFPGGILRREPESHSLAIHWPARRGGEPATPPLVIRVPTA